MDNATAGRFAALTGKVRAGAGAFTFALAVGNSCFRHRRPNRVPDGHPRTPTRLAAADRAGQQGGPEQSGGRNSIR